jgi:hypothetical protein
MHQLIKQEFGVSSGSRQHISERLAPMALSAYRSQEGFGQALRAFSNGGTLTDAVWKLTRGDDAFEVLDIVLARAFRRSGCGGGTDRAGRDRRALRCRGAAGRTDGHGIAAELRW